MRIPLTLVLSLTAASLGACQQKPPVAEAVEPPSLEAVLPNMPLPLGAVPLTSGSGKDAMQFLFTSPAAADSVVAYYRDVLGKPPYRLINEATTAGVTSFYVEQDGPSMWIMVQKNGETGSMVTIAGAASDSTKSDSAKKPAAAPN